MCVGLAVQKRLAVQDRLAVQPGVSAGQAAGSVQVKLAVQVEVWQRRGGGRRAVHGGSAAVLEAQAGSERRRQRGAARPRGPGRGRHLIRKLETRCCVSLGTVDSVVTRLRSIVRLPKTVLRRVSADLRAENTRAAGV